VIVSKYVGCVSITPSAASLMAVVCTSSKARAKSANGTGRPRMRMRSTGSARCGDVYSPVSTPASRSVRSIIAQVEPFPLVPAT